MTYWLPGGIFFSLRQKENLVLILQVTTNRFLIRPVGEQTERITITTYNGFSTK